MEGYEIEKERKKESLVEGSQEATIGGGDCDEPTLLIWDCLRCAFLVDTLALVFSFLFQFYLWEFWNFRFWVTYLRFCHLGEGLRSIGHVVKTSRAITTTLTEVLNNNLENVAHSFVSKAELQRVIANTCVIHSRFFVLRAKCLMSCLFEKGKY